VTSVERVAVPWYHRWGVRLTANGWLYAVGGRDAVRVGLGNGRALFVGTDEPERLVDAIESNRPVDPVV
jgi:hypothetical protein